MVHALRRHLDSRYIDLWVVDPVVRQAFAPALPQALGWPALKALCSTWSPRPLWRKARVRWVRDLAVDLDPVARRLTLAVHPPLSYDLGVVATGGRPHWDAIPGLDGGLPSLATLAHAALVAARLPRFAAGGRMVMVAAAAPDGSSRPLPDLPLVSTLARFRRTPPAHGQGTHWTLVVPTPRPAPLLGQTGSQTVAQLLVESGVELLTGATVVARQGSTLHLVRDGHEERLRFDHLVWLPPWTAHRWIRQSGLAGPGGAIPVTVWQQHVSHPDLYALGDAADSGPPWGSLATLGAEAAALHIAHRLDNRPLPSSVPDLVEWMGWVTPGRGVYAVAWGGRTVAFVQPWPTDFALGWQAAWARQRGWIPLLYPVRPSRAEQRREA